MSAPENHRLKARRCLVGGAATARELDGQPIGMTADLSRAIARTSSISA